ncbi:hypothetical protein PAMP_016243 [Pampus punctatissimus]
MNTLKEEEENRQRDGMRDGGERFACISVEEMKSYYTYTHRCQQLHNYASYSDM